MTGRDAFKIWAPSGVPWAAWVRPVPFAAPDKTPAPAVVGSLALPTIAYTAAPQSDTALIVDLPGADGIKEGVALAGLGYRPVPLYNGTNAQEGAMPLVDNGALAAALQWGALALEKISIPANAPPAFLLDSNRTHRHKMNASVFDNSWDIYPQDMPSAEYFLASGIRRIIVRGDAIQNDLCRILYPFQKKGIAILFTGGYSPAEAVVLNKPPRVKN